MPLMPDRITGSRSGNSATSDRWPHGFNTVAQGGNHQVCSLLEFGNAVLPDAKVFGDPQLRELPPAAKLLKAHFFRIRLADQFAVKPPFAAAGFIAGNEQDGLALWIEGDAPFTIGRAETQLLHVCVVRAGKSIDAQSSQARPELLQKAGEGKKFRLHVIIQHASIRTEAARL